jgi:5-methylcytosine-specific restriction enzyme A
MSKNPNWTNDEHILALDLYFSSEGRLLEPSDKKVIELSHLLNSLPIHSDELRTENFRNPDGVSMKLGNFRRLDPNFEGVGLPHGAKGEITIWKKYLNNKTDLKRIANAIKDNINVVSSPSKGEELDEEFEEGKLLTRVHRYRERNSSLIRKKKKKVIEQKGKLKCEVCSFDFKDKYGELGEGFAECHHTIPVSELKDNQKTTLSDLSILCANCHRMIHRSKPMLSVPELKNQLKP